MAGARHPPQSMPRAAPRRGAALSFWIACCTAAFLVGCGSAPTRGPAPAPEAGAARPGGYYKDDGPGDNPPADLAAIADAEPRVEPLHRFANNPYNVFGQDYVPLREIRPYKERGTGSWYGRKFHGQRTSSGEPYDMYAMTAAHPVLPIPSYARVTNMANGRSVIVRINDRGPFRPGRIIDLSYTAAWKLGYTSAGSAVVEVESITPEAIPLLAVTPAPGAPTHAAASGIYLQLGAFSARENADAFRSRLSSQLAWLDRAIEVLQRDGLFRLHLGPYRDRAEAGGVAERIREALDLNAVIIAR